MRTWMQMTALGLVLAVAACNRPAPTAMTEATTQAIAWREGDVDAAFAEAKDANKPVLLYWGANWCPPCNQMKQMLFKDPGFIAETRNFISVHLDGDSKNAQKWGEAFGISGYPTVIIFRPDRTEITRLGGSSTGAALTNVLKLAAKRVGSSGDLLKRADIPARLTAEDWQLLASFDWRYDPKHFNDPARSATFLQALADAAPTPALQRHFALISLANRATTEASRLTPGQQAQLRALLPVIFTHYDEAKADRQELVYNVPDLLSLLPADASRTALGNQLIGVLDRLAGDTTLPLDDRLAFVIPDLELLKQAGHSATHDEVLAKVRSRIAQADRAATNPTLRQAVMPLAGQILDAAGDPAGAMKLWKAELAHSVAPYFYMSNLAGAAERTRDYPTAIDWLKRAAEADQGAATRVESTIQYSEGMLRMRPEDKAGVEDAASLVIQALAKNSAGYATRINTMSAGWATKLRDWSKSHDAADLIARLSGKLDTTCTQDGCRNPFKA